MEQKLFSELRSLYVTTKERPNEIRIRIRMRDLIAPDALPWILPWKDIRISVWNCRKKTVNTFLRKTIGLW